MYSAVKQIKRVTVGEMIMIQDAEILIVQGNKVSLNDPFWHYVVVAFSNTQNTDCIGCKTSMVAEVYGMEEGRLLAKWYSWIR